MIITNPVENYIVSNANVHLGSSSDDERVTSDQPRRRALVHEANSERVGWPCHRRDHLNITATIKSRFHVCCAFTRNATHRATHVETTL